MILEKLNVDTLQELIQKKQVTALREHIKEHSAIDIAELIEQMEDQKDILFIFKTVQNEYTADIFSFLNTEAQEKIITSLSAPEIDKLLDNLATDDVVDFVEELPSNLVTKVLGATDKETRADINKLLNYEPSSAGSIMTTEYIELKENMKASEALAKIRELGPEAETIETTFVVDKSRVLLGTLKLDELLFSSDDVLVSDIMKHDYQSVLTSTDQEEVAMLFKKYDLNTIPVINGENRIVGIITVDDIMDVLDEEANEDFSKMNALSPLDSPYLKTGVFKLASKRIVWLLILMISGTFTGLIINQFESTLAVIPVLTSFIPMLMDTSGNAGSQTTTLIIRGMATGEFEPKNYLKILWKEFRVALIAGFVVMIFNFFWIWGEISIGMIKTNGTAEPWVLSALVATTLYIVVILAKCIGSTLPIIAKKIHLDPALMSGPFVTTIADAVSLCIYFLMAGLILQL